MGKQTKNTSYEYLMERENLSVNDGVRSCVSGTYLWSPAHKAREDGRHAGGVVLVFWKAIAIKAASFQQQTTDLPQKSRKW